MKENNDSTRIETTADGTSTLFSPAFNQHYHNPNGAVAESRQVFFDTPKVMNSIKQKENLNIFETGFGTGLNLLLLMEYLKKSKQKTSVTFFSVEAFPVDAGLAGQFDFGDNHDLNKSKNILVEIFKNQKPGLNHFEISEQITLQLFIGFFDELFQAKKLPKHFDFIFHDPFSPEVNPELWTPDVFEKLASISQKDAILSTYCAASSARAAMAAAGWYVARARGALGKREMTVASLNPEKLGSFKRVNEKRLIERLSRGEFNSKNE